MNLSRRISLIVCLVLFIVFATSASISWYKLGRGLSYFQNYKIAEIIKKQTNIDMHRWSPTGPTWNEEIVNISKKEGIIFSVLMTTGISLSVLFFFVITIIMLTTPLLQNVDKWLFKLFPVIILWGTIFGGFANRMRARFINQIWMDGEGPFFDAFIMLLGFSIIFALVIAMGLLVRRILIKRTFNDTSKEQF